MKDFETLKIDYANRIVSGKTLPRFQRLHGAVEIESASAKDERETRAFFNDARVTTDYDPSIRTACGFPHRVELITTFENADVEHVIDVANRFATFSTANDRSGIHVHMNASALVGNLNRASSVARLARLKACLISCAKRWENLLFGMNGARIRENNSHVDYMNRAEFDQALTNAEPYNTTLRGCARGQKYKLVNFTNLYNEDYPLNDRTIEFRAWSASKGFREDFHPTSALHVESALFVLFNMLSTALSETNKLSALRFTPKHPRAFDSFKWFLHHCAKRSQLPIWSDFDRVKTLIDYIFNQCKKYDNELNR